MEYQVEAGRVQTRSLELHITDHCNLRCDHCCSFSPILPRWFADPAVFADDLETGRARLRDLVADGLRRAQELTSQPPDGVVLALPVALDRNGIAQSATYPGLFGPVEPVFADVLSQQPWVVLNDALLAALAFRQPPEKRLVVTLGYGIGGALWDAPLRSRVL